MRKSSAKQETETQTEHLINQIKKHPIYIILCIIVALITVLGGLIDNSSKIETAWNNFFPRSAQDQPAKPVYIYPGHGNYVTNLVWSPLLDAERIASGGYDNTIQIWDATSGSNRIIHQNGNGVSWSPNGKYIASWTDTTVEVWEAATNHTITQYKIHDSSDPIDIISVTWSPDSKRIASTDYGSIHVWNIFTGHDILVYHSNISSLGGVTYSLAWSPNSDFIASTIDNKVQVWNATTGHLVTTFSKGSGSISVLAWSPDGKFIASGGDNGHVERWYAFSGFDVNNTDPNTTVMDHVILACPMEKNKSISNKAMQVTDITWSPNNRYIAYECLDGSTDYKGPDSKSATVFVCDFLTNHFSEYAGLAAAWSPDNKYFAVAKDYTVDVWQQT